MSAWLYGDNFQRWYDNGEAHIAEHVWEIGEVPQTVRTFGSVGGEGDQGALDVFLNGGKGVWHVEPQHRRARWSKRVSERWAHITVEIVGKFGWRDGQSDWTQIICQYVGSVELHTVQQRANEQAPCSFSESTWTRIPEGRRPRNIRSCFHGQLRARHTSIFAVPQHEARLHVFVLSSEPVSSGQAKTILTVDNEVVTICSGLPRTLPSCKSYRHYDFRLHEAFCAPAPTRSEVNVAALLVAIMSMCGFHLSHSRRIAH